jgi:acyl-CoA synthetase (AMP-forming)/AMP-acid ligase II
MTLTADKLYARCRRKLAGYKQPKDIRFVAFADLPRSTTGKIQCHEVEAGYGAWKLAMPAHDREQ